MVALDDPPTTLSFQEVIAEISGYMVGDLYIHLCSVANPFTAGNTEDDAGYNEEQETAANEFMNIPRIVKHTKCSVCQF